MVFSSDELRHEFITTNMPLVYSRMFKITHGYVDDDLFQIGCVGLIVAIERFDPALGYAFSTYATKYIDGYMKSYKSNDHIIKPYRKENLFFYKDVDELDRPINEDGDLLLGDAIPDDKDTDEEAVDAAYIANFSKLLKERDSLILKLLLDDIRPKDIMKIAGISRQGYYNSVQRISKKYIQYQGDLIRKSQEEPAP